MTEQRTHPVSVLEFLSQALRFFREHRLWGIVFVVALANDIFDYFGGAIPVFGDILDLATSAVLYPVIGPYVTAFTAIEFIPGADYLPVHTTLVLWALWRAWNRGDLDAPVEEVDLQQLTGDS